MPVDLLKLFNAEQGIVCCVGAGGKKTTMFRLAAEHNGRRGITATSHIEIFPRSLSATKYVAPENELIRLISEDNQSRVIAFALPSERKGRYAGISLDKVDEFRRAAHLDLMVIKSDGARGRLLKAPAEHEPPIPDCVNTVIPVVSARCLGMRLTQKCAHRLDYIESITGLRENDLIGPEHVARLMVSDSGALKNCHQAMVIPLINMVDDGISENLARQTAAEALMQTNRFDKVILASMINENPVIDIITGGH